MPAEQTAEKQPKPKLPQFQLQIQLDRLLRVKEELWEECQPIPRELLEKIRAVRVQLGLE